MKIAMMTRWNIPCGVSLHAELIGRAWVEMGRELHVFAPIERVNYQCDKDEPYVTRSYTLRSYRKEPGFHFDPKPLLSADYDVFVAQNLEILPMEELLEIYPFIKERAKTVLVIHEGKPPKDPVFYQFDWDAVVCFDERYKNFLKKIYHEEKIRIIPYPCHPVLHGDKQEARAKLGLLPDKKILFNFGIGIYRHIHLLPTLEKVNRSYPLILLTLTHIREWYDLFAALKSRYPFIELREGDLPQRELYDYLHASDALLLHKDSAEAVVVPSTVNLCLGSGCPILAYNTNFFETFGGEVIKYSNLGETLMEIFEGRRDVTKTVKRAEGYATKYSAQEIARRFLELFELLPAERKVQVAA